ncbi:MAG: hypothetical protein NVSMB21_09410 [Vulcanimicrobiaceae bacterium]
MPLIPAAVTVVLDGRTIDASSAARLSRATVVAPLEPFVVALADRIERRDDGCEIVIVRGERSIVVRVGSVRARSGTLAETLPIAPYVLAGETIIPLAAIARALGATVGYDAASRTVTIVTMPEPLAAFSAVPYVVPPPGSVPTFAPHATPAPRPTVTGIPRPRRTPIVIEPDPP